MKHITKILLLLIGFVSYGQITPVNTLQIKFPRAGVITDSIIVWRGSDKLTGYVPASELPISTDTQAALDNTVNKTGENNQEIDGGIILNGFTPGTTTTLNGSSIVLTNTTINTNTITPSYVQFTDVETGGAVRLKPILPIPSFYNLSFPNISGTLATEGYVDTEIKNSGFVNANLFGYLPTNTASQNVAAMQAILDGGNKTVIVPMPGTYFVNGENLVYDNTEIIYGEGAIVEKTANFVSVFINSGAYTRTYNENIILRNFTLKVNGFEGQYATTSPIYGVRGHVNFYYTKNWKAYDSKCLDLGTVQWLFSVNRSEDFLIDGLDVAGMKDGVNLGNSVRGVIRNVRSSCYDDTLGLNPFGYPQSSPEVGSLKDIVIENVYYTHNPEWPDGGRVFNFQMGTVSDWYSGKMILTGDIVNAGGNTYIAITTPTAGVETASVTEPTIEVFNSVQTTGEGITWRIQKLNETTAQAQLENIIFRNIVHNSEELGVILTYFAGNDGTDSRTVHPDVLVADYPEAKNIKFDGLKTKYGYFNVKAKLGHNTEITGLQDHLENIFVISSEDTDKKSIWNFHDNNFGAVNTGFVIGDNGDVTLNNNIQDGVINMGGLTGGRLNGNTNVDIDPSTLNDAQLGDIIKVDGVVKKFNGTAFVNNATLDEVTDVGNTTTNDVTFGKVTFGDGAFAPNIPAIYFSPTLGTVFTAKAGSIHQFFMTDSGGNAFLQVPIGTIKAEFQGPGSFTGELTVPTAVAGTSATPLGQVQAIADAKVADSIINGVTTIAPSQNAVFDALALKADNTSLPVVITQNEVIDFPDPSSHSAADATPFTVTGAAVGDEVIIVPPLTILNDGTLIHCVYYAFVSATNEVTARVQNPFTSGVTIPSATYKIIIRK